MRGPNHTKQGRGRWAGQLRGRIHCACRGGARGGPVHALAQGDGWGVSLRMPGLSVLWAPRGPEPPGRVGVGWSPGMARSRLALLLPPLVLLGLVSSTQIDPDYQYFGQQGTGDTWELLRLQRKKGKLEGGGSDSFKRYPQKPHLASWLHTDPPVQTLPSSAQACPLGLATFL